MTAPLNLEARRPRPKPSLEMPTSGPEVESDDDLAARFADEDAAFDREHGAEDATFEAETGAKVESGSGVGSGRLRVEDDAWHSKLIFVVKLDKDGEPKRDRSGNVQRVLLPNAANVTTILRFHPAWRNVVVFDAFAAEVMLTRAAPWFSIDAPKENAAGPWTDADTGRLVNWLSRAEGLTVNPKVVESALMVAAAATTLHPVREYLDALAWDGVARLDSMLAVYLHAADTPYTRGVSSRWMISAVARVMRPGCQADCTLLLEGEQGRKKTSAFRELVPIATLYADTSIDLGNKDSLQNLRGVWIYGLDELDSLSRSELTRTKNFLTQTIDRYRPSYARRAQAFARQNVFCGTTNDGQYFNDSTGNRRFWPVKVEGEADVDAIRRDRDQLWAEALHRFRAGEAWHVDTPEFRALCEAEQAERLHTDPWEPLVATWLEKPLRPDPMAPDRVFDRVDLTTGVRVVDVLLYAVGKRPGDVTKADEMRVGVILRALGYERGPQLREGGARIRRYVKVAE